MAGRPWTLPLVLLVAALFWLFADWRGLTAARADVEALQAREAELEAELAPSEQAAPLPEDRLPDLYRAVLRLAEVTKLEVVALNPGEEGAFSLEVKGGYRGVYAFLTQLRKLPFPLWVRSFTLRPENEEGTRFDLTLELGVRLETEDEEAP